MSRTSAARCNGPLGSRVSVVEWLRVGYVGHCRSFDQCNQSVGETDIDWFKIFHGPLRNRIVFWFVHNFNLRYHWWYYLMAHLIHPDHRILLSEHPALLPVCLVMPGTAWCRSQPTKKSIQVLRATERIEHHNYYHSPYNNCPSTKWTTN